MPSYDNEDLDDQEVQEEFLRQMTTAHIGFTTVGMVFIGYQIFNLM